MIGNNMLDESTIKKIYNDNGLAYHNWAHITEMLRNLDTHFKNYLNEENYNLLRDAIIFHDIIYVPGAVDNEEKSARAYVLHQTTQNIDYGSMISSPAKRVLSTVPLNQPVPEETNPVYRLIMSTKTHTAVKAENLQLHMLSKILVDLDLWGLGDSWLLYALNGNAIRKEFLDAGISEEQFNHGRKEWIRRFLERDRIYLTEFCEDRELRATYNLKKELFILNLQESNGLPVQE